MKIERHQFRDAMENQNQRVAKTRASEFRAASQAATAMGNLTASEDWNLLVRCVQHLMDQAQTEVTQLRENLSHPQMVEYAHIVETKIRLANAVGRLDAYAQVIELPEDITTSGEKARELLKQSEETPD